MEKAHKVEKLIPGKFYLVACALMENKRTGRVMPVPVIPILHSDPEFGASGAIPHYHIDGRFTPREAFMGGYTVVNHKSNGIISNPTADYNRYHFKGIEYKKRKCRTLDSGLEIERYNPVPLVWENFTAKHKGKPIGPGNRCPHYGAIMQMVNGRLVCPMHNLEGCPKTMKIITPRRIEMQTNYH